jgi:TRAP-type C4-dicarboxylate transport system permease large subunit
MRPGMNFRVAGLGVASVWMNMAFSGVAGSRPARELCLADGYGKGTVKGSIAFSSESLPRT